MNVKKIRKLSLSLFYIGLLCFSIIFITGFLRNQLIIFTQLTIGLLCIFVSLILNFLFWKCPNCGKRFEMKNGKVDRNGLCPYCKTKIV